MFGKQPDRVPSAIHCSNDRGQPVTLRSALLNHSSPHRHRAQQVRFKDLEDGQDMTLKDRTCAERCRLGAAPGSPHPNRKSTLWKESTANRGVVRGEMAAPLDAVVPALGRAPPNSLTPAPSRQVPAPPPLLAPSLALPSSMTLSLLHPPFLSTAIQMCSLQKPLPLYVTRTRSHSLEDVIGTEGATAQLCCHANNSPGEGLPLQNLTLSAPVINYMPSPPPRSQSSSCPPISKTTGSNNPHQSRRQQLGRALRNPGNKHPTFTPLSCTPPTSEDTPREGVEQRQLPLPPLPPPPPPYQYSKKGSCTPRSHHTLPLPRSNHTPPMPCPWKTPQKTYPHNTPSTLSKPYNTKITQDRTPNPHPACNPTPNLLPTPKPYSTPNLHPNPHPAPNLHPTPNLHPAPNPTPNPHPTLCQQRDPTLHSSTYAPLTPDQAQTRKQVQNLLGRRVSGARGEETDLASTKERLLGPMRDVRGLRKRLQSLEGLLETSHSTIRLLLDIIHDQECNKAGTERRPRYRTAQSIDGGGTSTDCVIYSVENDFMLQEGKFTHSWMTADPQISDHSSSKATSSPNPRRKEPSPATRPPHSSRKGRRKCFWFP